jgi:hypothetical protein
MELTFFNNEINIIGFVAGAYTFLIIMFARWLCIWGEFHFTKKFWLFFLITGIITVIASLFFEDLISSVILSLTGFIFLWGINETIEQEERVNKGWFPKKNK